MAVSAAAQDGAGESRVLRFSLDRPEPPVQYTITLGESGAGVYLPHRATGDPLNTTGAGSAAVDVKTLRVSPAVVKKLFAAVPTVEGGRCETHNKGLAKTGVKELRYAGAGREGQCTFNYSDDERVNDATTIFEAIAETMRYGDRLTSKLRFDRLGLDAELDGLQDAVSGGRAAEVGNIASVLQTISDDERVMDRVRRKATRLLQAAGQGQAVAGTGPSER